MRTGRSLAFSWSRGSSRLCAAPKRKTDTTLAEWRTWSYVAIPARARATSDMSEHPPRRATVLGRGTSTAAIAATSRNDAPRRPRIADISEVRSDVVPRDHGGTSSRRQSQPRAASSASGTSRGRCLRTGRHRLPQRRERQSRRRPLPGGCACVAPERITIYRTAICGVCNSEREVVEQVRRTVVHEVGHPFGIDDARRCGLGW